MYSLNYTESIVSELYAEFHVNFFYIFIAKLLIYEFLFFLPFSLILTRDKKYVK